MFSRDKLFAGVQRATEKTSVTTMQIEELISRIEKHLYESGESEVASTEVGSLVMDELSMIDDVAYVRFASVYRQFKDIASFERELSRIKDK
jgi:transcriptional repressor NrdR